MKRGHFKVRDVSYQRKEWKDACKFEHFPPLFLEITKLPKRNNK